ncbi:MAG: two pore domain potassium channel family protein [Acidobacteriaceae bacterium]|nr:two pore domain potassium channel family protein [Acidobacteriaceae bacterium]
MHIFVSIAGAVVILAVLLDAFETVVLPRRVQRHFRITSWFYRHTWRPWRALISHIQLPTRRENFLGYFGPLSIILLLGLWALGLIFGFALLQYGAGEHVQLSNEPITFGRLIYHSGETFFTLGYGDIVPTSPLSRTLAVMEAGLGFGFLGTVIGYLPTLYASFSRREVQISLLDVRAGSPPTAAELLARLGTASDKRLLDQVFRDWERLASEILESHISYPVLCYFRSQHTNQSWLGALTAILDTTALVLAGVDALPTEQAKMTFAMARHAVVDLAQVVNARYDRTFPDRLPDDGLAQFRQSLAARGISLKEGDEFAQKLGSVRMMYEPYAQALARTLLITLPPWIQENPRRDNWKAGPWDALIQAKGLGAGLAPHRKIEDHF